MSRMALGPHAAFIVIAYAAVVLIILALTAWVIGDYRRQQALLRRLEAEGVTRRSAQQDERT